MFITGGTQWRLTAGRKKAKKLKAECGKTEKSNLQILNLLTPMNDQDRISPYNIKTISCRKVMRIKRNINMGIIS